MLSKMDRCAYNSNRRSGLNGWCEWAVFNRPALMPPHIQIHSKVVLQGECKICKAFTETLPAPKEQQCK